MSIVSRSIIQVIINARAQIVVPYRTTGAGITCPRLFYLLLH